jgi:hypothetical protein
MNRLMPLKWEFLKGVDFNFGHPYNSKGVKKQIKCT